MSTQIDPEWLELELKHAHGGDGFAIVQDLGDEYVRVSGITRTGVIGSQAFLAWTKKLSPMLRAPDRERPTVKQPFTKEQMNALNQIRGELASGKKKVVATHIVPA